jgi:hypothetical protein
MESWPARSNKTVFSNQKKRKYYAKEETKVLDERVSTLALQLDDGARLFL